MDTKLSRRVGTNKVEESDHSTQSSPDPLALSPVSPPRRNRNHYSKVTRLKTHSRAPLSRTSENVQQFAHVCNGTYHMNSSPSKSFVMNTDGTAGASPWRIKVTVEAEPHSHNAIDENASPTKSAITSTQTTIIPLRDPDDRTPIKRRGRPRKSEADKAKAGKRGSTSAMRRSSNRRSSVQSCDTAVTSEDNGVSNAPPKGARARARETIQQVNERSDEPCSMTEQKNITAEGSEHYLPVPPTHGSSQEKRQKHTMFNFSNLTPLHQKHVLHNPKLQTPEIRTPDPTMKPVHGRRCTPVQHNRWSVQSETLMAGSCAIAEEDIRNASEWTQSKDSTSQGPLAWSKQSDQTLNSSSQSELQGDTGDRLSKLRDADMWRGMIAFRNHEGMLSINEAEDFEDEDRDIGEVTLEAIGEETMQRSEEFSIVSISSLPSIRESLCCSSNLPAATSITLEAIQPQETGIHEDAAILAGNHTIHSIAMQGTTTDQADIAVNTPSFMPSSPPVTLAAQQTPWVSVQSPSCPPTLGPSHILPLKTSTPKLVKVVRAGIALQGVLDTDSPSSPVKPSNTEVGHRKERLDALFSGFGEGTRRELQAGLRLGEQLANRSRQRSTNTSISPPGTGTADWHLSKPSTDDIFGEPAPSPAAGFGYPRLPTPEEKDHYALALPPPPSAGVDVVYPSLNVSIQQAHLISPARSASAMSWRVEMPLHASHSAWSNEQESTAGTEEHNHLGEEEPQAVRDTAVPIHNPQTTEDHTDIWLEEASRSSDLPSTAAAVKGLSKVPSPQPDLFLSEGLLKPRRSKLPKTWRRTSGSDFTYSDEAEAQAEGALPVPCHQSSLQETKPAVLRSESSHSADSQVSDHSTSHGGKTPSESTEEDESEQADDADDTGMFWQHNLPAVFQKPVPHNLKGDRIDLSMLLGLDNSPLHNSPLHRPHRFTPIKHSPLRRIALARPPTKSSPLKRQIVVASHWKDVDIDDSFVDGGVSGLNDTMTSDMRQLKAEMELAQREISTYDEEIDSTFEQKAEEVEGENYEGSSIVGRSGTDEELATSPVLPSVSMNKYYSSPLGPRSAQRPSFASWKQDPPTTTAIPVAAPAQASLFTRFASTLWSALPFAAPQLTQPTHHLLANYPLLPKYEPWSKTHYKALDHLYQRFKAEPSLFAPLDPSNKGILLPKSTANAELRKYVNFRMRNWGYEVRLSDQHMVIVGLYMQLLQLASREEYALKEGREIEVLETEVGKLSNGDIIGVREVVIKLFTVVAGEMVRMDEKMGRNIDRSPGQWMQRFRGERWELLG